MCTVSAKGMLFAAQEVCGIVWLSGTSIPGAVSHISWTMQLQVNISPCRSHISSSVNALCHWQGCCERDADANNCALFAVVREVLRITPVVPALFRRALNDFQLGGRLIPKVAFSASIRIVFIALLAWLWDDVMLRIFHSRACLHCQSQKQNLHYAKGPCSRCILVPPHLVMTL